MKTNTTKHCKNNVHLLKFNESVCSCGYDSFAVMILNEIEAKNAI